MGDLFRGETWASSNMLRTFALSSAASSLRKPPDSERCTTCRDVVDGLTYTRSGGTALAGGGTVPSQGKASEAASPGSPGLIEASRPWNPLA